MQSLEVLEGHGFSGNGNRRMLGNLGNLVRTFAYERYTASLDAVPEAGHPLGPDDPYGGIEPGNMAKARQESIAGRGAMACLPTRALAHARTTPRVEYVTWANNSWA